MLIARGALISVILIFFVLPLLFTLLDGLVRVTSYKIGFYRGGQSERPAASPASPASN